MPSKQVFDVKEVEWLGRLACDRTRNGVGWGVILGSDLDDFESWFRKLEGKLVRVTIKQTAADNSDMSERKTGKQLLQERLVKQMKETK